MRPRALWTAAVAAAVAAAGLTVSGTGAAHATSSFTLVPLIDRGTSSFTAGASGSDPSGPVDLSSEIDQATVGDTDSGDGQDFGNGVNRSLPATVDGKGQTVNPNKKAKSNPELGTRWDGLNFRQQRLANGGNQFSVEPPDQALCAGSGHVLEAVNDVTRVFNTDGTPATGVTDLNTFFGYPAAINRSTLAYGPDITDPVCLYDQPTGRFFLTVLTLDRVGTTSTLAGTDHLDIAVSNSSDPTGGWHLYQLDVTNDGNNGTPDHACPGGCLGDYPHIGADANGIYLTTNEFGFNGGFFGSQIYALSKAALASGASTPVVEFDTNGAGPDGAGFTVWPASVPSTRYATGSNGTEYLLSSRAVFSDNGTSSQLIQWQLTNTASLNTATPSPALSLRTVPVQPYSVPGRATQQAGDYPLGQLSNEPLGQLDAGDSRMQQVMYANGKLWGSLGTGVVINGRPSVGIGYYVINPSTASVTLQGQTGLPGTDLTYPAVGVTDSGRGVISFTLTGDHDYPSAGYLPVDAKVGAGAVHLAAAGVGPQDGFTEYPKVVGQDRPRWGDYGATSVTGNSIWVASEYIAQTCTVAQYQATNGSCGGTRTALGNWATRISKLTP